MEYRKFGQTLLVRLDRGEEVLAQLLALAEKEQIHCAMVNALGATDHFSLGVYDVARQEYFRQEYQGAYEIVSLHGSITTMDGKPYLHLHMSAGDQEGHFVGGHLNACTISATCEMFVTLVDGEVGRVKDETIGINLLSF